MNEPEAPPPVRNNETAAAEFTAQRLAESREMVDKQLIARGITDQRVLAAMLAVPRHAFVSTSAVPAAYNDQPLGIGEGQTISQPFMVGSMSQELELTGQERVLEIGTGSGYQAAVLSLLAREVHTVESIPVLAESARERLHRLGYTNVHVHVGDGTRGWPENAPYDAILVTAAAPSLPAPLVDQLADGGRMVIPVGPADMQELVRVRRRGTQIIIERFYHCRFVPLIGEHGWDKHESEHAFRNITE